LVPPRDPAVDGINSLETIVGKLGDPPCKELDVQNGGVIINWFLGVAAFRWDIFEGAKPKGLRRSNLVCPVKPRSPPASSGIQWGDERVFFRTLRNGTDCSAGVREPVILEVGSHAEKELKKIDPWEDSKVSLA
jgi:hypothetical protein